MRLLSKASNSRASHLRQAQQIAQTNGLYESLTLTLAMLGRVGFYLQLVEHGMEMGNEQGALLVLVQIENHHQCGVL